LNDTPKGAYGFFAAALSCYEVPPLRRISGALDLQGARLRDRGSGYPGGVVNRKHVSRARASALIVGATWGDGKPVRPWQKTSEEIRQACEGIGGLALDQRQRTESPRRAAEKNSTEGRPTKLMMRKIGVRADQDLAIMIAGHSLLLPEVRSLLRRSHAVNNFPHCGGRALRVIPPTLNPAFMFLALARKIRLVFWSLGLQVLTVPSSRTLCTNSGRRYEFTWRRPCAN
jgi:hypothetical protein